MSTSKVIIITGGTGGIGYQAALALASKPEKHTVVVTGRSQGSGEKAVLSLKEATGNPNIEYAVADMSAQKNVTALGKDLLKRFPKIDEVINNAGNLSTGAMEQAPDGVDKNFAVNVIAPLILTRALVPALKAATPKGRVQITSGGMPFDTLKVDDLESVTFGVGIPAYSHSKRVMEAMVISLAEELKPEGIVVNAVGGAVVAATGMTSAMSFKDMPWMMKPLYPLLKLFAFRPDNNKSAFTAAGPAIAAALATPEELGGTGQSLLSYPKVGSFKPEVLDKDNQAAVMKYVEEKLV